MAFRPAGGARNGTHRRSEPRLGRARGTREGRSDRSIRASERPRRRTSPLATPKSRRPGSTLFAARARAWPFERRASEPKRTRAASASALHEARRLGGHVKPARPVTVVRAADDGCPVVWIEIL